MPNVNEVDMMASDLIDVTDILLDVVVALEDSGKTDAAEKVKSAIELLDSAKGMLEAKESIPQSEEARTA
ncbi:MAG: hypothetical protein V2A69_15915 [Pseudomonadota bacterium]